MKFLTKINRNYFFLLGSILLVVSVAGYFILRTIVMNETRETLMQRREVIRDHISATGTLPRLDPIIQAKPASYFVPDTFKKVFLYDKSEGEDEPYLEYTGSIEVGGHWYTLTLRQSMFENTDFIVIIAATLFVLLAVAFAIFFFFSKKMNRRLWSGFEYNLHQIEALDLSRERKPGLQTTGIEEFDRLNRVVANMAHRLQTEYRVLKEFTENASHEIQTPLSIVMLNLEEVLQQNLDEATFRKINTSVTALRRLSQLNQSLALLTRIENQQFAADKVISFRHLFQSKLEEFAPFFETKNLTVDFSAEADFEIQMHDELARLLVNNLLSNATRHNIQNGQINIQLRSGEIQICNTGVPNNLDNRTIFNRFTKGRSSSYGLGLALVKKICDTHQLEISYRQDRLHCFLITRKT